MSNKKLAFATSHVAPSSTVVYKSALIITHGLLGQGYQHVSKAPTGSGRYLALTNQRWVSKGGSGGPAHADRSDPTVWCRVDLGPCNCRSADHLRRHPSLTCSFFDSSLPSHLPTRGERISAAENCEQHHRKRRLVGIGVGAGCISRSLSNRQLH